MNKVSVTKRRLSESEISQLIFETRSFPDLTYVSRDHWKRLKTLYVIETNGVFAGVCAVYEISNWIKLGPLVLIRQFHEKGYGKQLMAVILKSYPHSNILVASTNPKVRSLLNKYNFIEIKNYLELPLQLKFFLLKQFKEYLNIKCIIESIRKRLMFKRERFSFFVRYSS